MKTTELRQGNYANYKYWNPNPDNPSWEYREVEVVGVLKDTFYFKFKNDKRTNKIGELHPIPLTEEILLNSEIEKTFYGEYKLGNLIFQLTKYDTENLVTVFLNGNLINIIKHLHELQNLIFSLTNKELKINP